MNDIYCNPCRVRSLNHFNEKPAWVRATNKTRNHQLHNSVDMTARKINFIFSADASNSRRFQHLETFLMTFFLFFFINITMLSEKCRHQKSTFYYRERARPSPIARIMSLKTSRVGPKMTPKEIQTFDQPCSNSSIVESSSNSFLFGITRAR